MSLLAELDLVQALYGSEAPVARSRLISGALEEASGVFQQVSPGSLEQFRSAMAAHLSVTLEFLRSSADLERVAASYAPEMSFPLRSLLETQLRKEGAEGVLLRRCRVVEGGRRYLAVIDARGDRSYRAYFTAWHEIAHLLLERPDAGRPLRRGAAEKRDPFESVVDEVASRLAFYEAVLEPAVAAEFGQDSPICFAGIERIRHRVAPEASLYATAIAIVRDLEVPCCLVLARGVGGTDELVIEQVTWSRSAPGQLCDFRGMRVPDGSILRAATAAPDQEEWESLEDQGWWDGGHLSRLSIRVNTIRRSDLVYGLVAPVAEFADRLQR